MLYRKVLSAPETLNPYGTKQVPPKVEDVNGKWSATEGGRPSKTYSLDNPHSTGYIIPYIPDAKLGFVTDIWSPAPQIPAGQSRHDRAGEGRPEDGHPDRPHGGRPWRRRQFRRSRHFDFIALLPWSGPAGLFLWTLAASKCGPVFVSCGSAQVLKRVRAMPSSPMAQACANTVAPSPSMCSLNCSPGPAPPVLFRADQNVKNDFGSDLTPSENRAGSDMILKWCIFDQLMPVQRPRY